jgi:transposase/transposase IS204/IS1001/IS1096/IS1165 family protein
MLASFLLPDVPGLRLDAILTDDQTIHVTMTSTQSTAACPVCAVASSRIHSRYQRIVRDLPWAGHCIQVRLHVRRFLCSNPNCTRKIFAERLGPTIRAFARRTERLASQLCYLAFRLSAEAGAQMGKQLGMPVSAATLLRLQRHQKLPPPPAPQIIGVDDWAIRKGRTYGALIVDLERHQPIDVLPDAKAKTFATWLQQYPTITLISRDRAGNFAEGALRGAPQAIQVADRFHLFGNLGDALQRLLEQHPAALRAAAQQEEQQTGGLQAADCLILEFVPAWIATVSRANATPMVQERLRYFTLFSIREVYAAVAREAGLPIGPSRQIEDLSDLTAFDESIQRLAERQQVIEDSQEKARQAWRNLDARVRRLEEAAAEGKLSVRQRGMVYHLVQAWAQERATRERVSNQRRAACLLVHAAHALPGQPL